MNDTLAASTDCRFPGALAVGRDGCRQVESEYGLAWTVMPLSFGLLDIDNERRYNCFLTNATIAFKIVVI
jgi:hypothetical protein